MKIQRTRVCGFAVYTATEKMEEPKWDVLNIHCLANIFGRVEIESLLFDVPFVRKSWSKATLSPLCWCPDLRNLELPIKLHWDLMLKIPNLISKWKHLEHLGLDKRGFWIISQISIHCQNFHSLTVKRDLIGKGEASAIVTLLPNIRYLDLSSALINKENLMKVLQGCKELVHFEVTNWFLFKVDDEILQLGSRISTFKYCDRMAFGRV